MAHERELANVYAELRRIAAALLRRERPDHTLQPTALVHEAFLKLVQRGEASDGDRLRILPIAAQAMRRILIDHARGRNAAKRGGDRAKLTLMEPSATTLPNGIDAIALEEALTELEQLHDRQHRVVELRFFGGLTEAEIAELLGVHRSTVADDWAAAKAFLGMRLAANGDAC